MKKSQLLFKVIAILIPSIFFFFSGNVWANSEPLKEWHEWEQQQNVPLHKTWSIEFNQVVDEESLHNESIFIENNRLEKIESKISLDETGKIVRIEPPTEGYQSDETYTLYITSKIASLDENLLKKPIKMRFSTISASPPFEPRENSSNTVDVKEAVKEVDETSILSITDSTVQVKEEDAGQLETGDIFFLPATYESPFGQARQVTEKINEGDNVTVSTEKPELEEIVSDMDLSQTIPISADQFIINPELLEDSSSNEVHILSNGGCQKKGSIEICDLKNSGVSINLKDLKIKKLRTTLNGSLELISPHVNVDIESGKILGIPYKFKFNRLEFAAEENLNFHLHSELSGSKKETIELASAPVPFAGFPKAGVNVVILLTVSADGNVSLDYTFEQSFTAKIGVQHNEKTEKLEPFKKIDFNLDHDLNIEGEANLDLSLESGVYVLIGNISVTDLTLTIDFDNNLKGKMVDLSKDDRFNPSGCYRFYSQLNALGKFSFGEEIDTKWFGKIGYEYEADLFKMKLFDGELGNCSYDSLQLLPNVKSLEPGEEGVFKVRGNVQNFDRTLKDLTIPSDYVTFKTKNTDLIKINENGEFQVNPDANHGDRLSIEVAYTDPISGKLVSNDLDIEIREKFLEFRSDLLGYSMLVESRALESMKIEEGTVDGKEHGSYLATAFFRQDDSIKDEKVFVGGISRYTHKQWKNYYSTLPDRQKIAETDYWIFAYSEPKEHPYKGEFLGEYSLPAIKYTNTQKKLKQATRTLKVFTEDVPDEEDNQLVTIPDPMLEMVIRSELNKLEGNITRDDMLKLTTLGSWGGSTESIKDLSGIEYALNLEVLDLRNHEISDISSLSHLTNLRTIGLENNQIKDLTALSNLTNLTWLHLGDNQISDISGLNQLTNLTSLFLGNNQISNIGALHSLTNLIHLYIENNKISDITALSALTSLQELNLDNNNVSDLNPLKKDLTKLRGLTLSNNQISDITALSALTSLEVLDLSFNSVSDLSSLKDLTKLRTLELSRNQISDVNPLGNLIHLKKLKLGYNQINIISPLTNLTELEELILWSNPIKDRATLQELKRKVKHLLY